MNHWDKKGKNHEYRKANDSASTPDVTLHNASFNLPLQFANCLVGAQQNCEKNYKLILINCCMGLIFYTFRVSSNKDRNYLRRKGRQQIKMLHKRAFCSVFLSDLWNTVLAWSEKILWWPWFCVIFANSNWRGSRTNPGKLGFLVILKF